MEMVSSSALFWFEGELRVECCTTDDGSSVHVKIGEPCHSVALMLTPDQLQRLVDVLSEVCEQRIVETVG